MLVVECTRHLQGSTDLIGVIQDGLELSYQLACEARSRFSSRALRNLLAYSILGMSLIRVSQNQIILQAYFFRPSLVTSEQSGRLGEPYVVWPLLL